MAKKITLKFKGTCADCGAELPEGSIARWYGKGRIYGIGCHEYSRPRSSGDRSNFYYSLESGNEWFQNKNGRCEDAPCCGCCS